MKFSRTKADVFTPDGSPAAGALGRVSHLCIAAHQDDIEIMAYSGICDCLGNPSKAFGGVVVTNGAGSPRSGPYASLSDLEMQNVRREEQREAARLGHYAVQIQLAHPSSDVKTPRHTDVVSDLAAIFSLCAPEVLYLHNPADKHDTHVAVLARCLEALKALPEEKRPKRVLGCEVWRDLDWLVDSDKIALNAGRFPELASKLLTVFASQVIGGKRYDLAALGRRLANATFHTSHATDHLSGITWAMDLTPLLADDGPSLEDFTLSHFKRLQDDVSARIRKFL